MFQVQAQLVGVTARPYKLDNGVEGVSHVAQLVLEVDGQPQVARLKLPRDMHKAAQAGRVALNFAPFVDAEGKLGVRLAGLQPVSANIKAAA